MEDTEDTEDTELQGKMQGVRKTVKLSEKLRVTSVFRNVYNSFISFIMSLILLSRIFSVSSNFSGDISFVFTLK
jgi:hypothetical protein